VKLKYLLFFIAVVVIIVLPSYGEVYKWVDEKGTIHFADDLSNIPERFRAEAVKRDTPGESYGPEVKDKPARPASITRTTQPEGIEINLLRQHELMVAEVILNDRLKQHFVVDTGASFTLISRQAARELDLRIDETTPFIPIFTVSSLIFTPLVTLKSLRVGKVEMENVDALIHDMPSGEGLLGNSFLSRYRVILDSYLGKMTIYSTEGISSPDRPGGYERGYWTGQFRFYIRILDDLKNAKKQYERKGASSELNRVNNAIRYFENRLDELERKASSAGVPRNWRE
jgi:clan AA aspartic protease (TIGR02281 family)